MNDCRVKYFLLGKDPSFEAVPGAQGTTPSTLPPPPGLYFPPFPVSAHVCLYLPVASTPEDPRLPNGVWGWFRVFTRQPG